MRRVWGVLAGLVGFAWFVVLLLLVRRGGGWPEERGW